MGKLAICIPTYNRADVLEDTFSYELDTCLELGIDIWIYDSSTDGKTRELMETLKGYHNVYYVSMGSSLSADEKVLMIYQSYARTKAYDYLWVVGDSVGFSRDLLMQTVDALETNPTMIIINHTDLQNLGNQNYDDVHAMFCELFWRSTLLGSVIIKEDLYNNIDWTPYSEKFVGQEWTGLGIPWYRLAGVQDFKGIHFSVKDKIDLRKSPLKKFAGWKGNADGSERVYKIWAEGIINTAYSIPFPKEEIKTALDTVRIYFKWFYWLTLCRSRKDGIYNVQIYKKYRKGIKMMSNYPDIILYLIAITPILPMKVIVRICDKFIIK